MRIAAPLFAASLLFFACATTKQSETPPVASSAPAPEPAKQQPKEAKPFDLQALLKREAAPLPLQAVASPDGAFQTRAEAKAPPQFSSQGEGMEAITLDVGTGAALTCFTYRDRIDPAGALYVVVTSIVGAVEAQSVMPTGVEVVAESPVLFVRLDYVAMTPEGKAAGQAKLAVSARPDVSFMCVHDEVGYQASFVRWVKTFGENLKGSGPAPEPARFREIQVLKLNDLPMGFSERSLYPRGDGMALESFNTMVLPRSKSELMASDTFTREETDPKGRVSAMAYVKSLNNELVSNVKLTRKKAAYAYEGQSDGKPIQGTFAAKEALVSDLLSWKLVKELLAGTKPSVTLTTYSASSDPTQPTSVTFTRDPSRDRGLKVDSGRLQFNATVDANGVPDHIDMPMGKMTLSSERLFVRGTP